MMRFIRRRQFLLSLSIVTIILFYNNSSAQIASLEATLKLQKVDGVNIPVQNGMPVPSFEKQQRQFINLQGEWKKQRFAAADNITLAKRDQTGTNNLLTEAANRHLKDYDDSAWELKILPAVENTMYEYPKVPEYYEDGVWYRKSFTIDDSLSGKFIKLMFYAVNYVADVWVNGQYLGYHEGGYTPFAFDVTDYLIYGNENVIAVRVDNPAWGTRNDIVPYYKVDWFNYTGIIHDVYLEITNPVSIIRTDIVPLDLDGTIQSTVVLLNRNNADKNIAASIEIYNADVNSTNIKAECASELIGMAASFSGTAQTSLSIMKDSVKVWRTNLTVTAPKFWSPKEPNLYVMKVTLKDGESTIDEYYTQFGIRTVRTQEFRVLLNDNPVFLTGVARHEDHPVYGRSIPIERIYDDLLMVKDVNANMLRTAHYPNHLYTYLIADRLGITILEEIPVWWFDDSLPWLIQNSVRHIHEQMFREMVFKDYNRPSILFWSTTNECKDVTNRKTFIQKVKQDLTFNYNDGRLITQSAAADRPGAEDESQAVCDVAGWTMYFGIFHGGTYYDGTRYFLGYANIAYPDKPILDTEFEYWSGETGGSQGTQVTVFNETFRAFQIRAAMKPDGSLSWGGFLIGVTWWCIFDWYSSQHPFGFQSMGLYNMFRDIPKQVAPVLRNAYAPYYNRGGIPVSVERENESSLPLQFKLFQNYPNPFNPSTRISFSIPHKAIVTMKVYDILGNEIRSLINEEKESGFYETEINLENLSSGIYICRLTASSAGSTGGFSDSKKMILLR